MMKNITIRSLLIFLLLFGTGENRISAKQAENYQVYRLTKHSADDRRPKLAINEDGTVWVAWESDRDGDFDIYGRKFENGDWSDLVEIAQDTNTTTLCDMIEDQFHNFMLFSTEIGKAFPYGTTTVRANLSYIIISPDSISNRTFISFVDHHLPELIYYESYYSNNLPKALFFSDSVVICYSRTTETPYSYSWKDSLFLRNFKNEWYSEKCDTFYNSYREAADLNLYHFPIHKIMMNNEAVFIINNYYTRANYPYGLSSRDYGLKLNRFSNNTYFLFNYKEGDCLRYKTGFSAYVYGSDTNTIFYGGYIIDKRKYVIRRSKKEADSLAIVKNEWQLDITPNLSISQMSDLVAFVWSDSANIYVTTFQDSLWYKTMEIPLNGLTHINQSLNCAVFNNQQIWVAFDAIYNGNKDVYALSVPASSEIDSTLTSVKHQIESPDLPGDFHLSQNCPNPFNSTTEIRYTLPQGRALYHVIIKIYDIRGRLVKVLIDQSQSVGMHAVKWNGTDINNHIVSSGIYFYTLQVGDYKVTRKMLLLE